MSEWIRVEDRLPEVNTHVLAFRTNRHTGREYTHLILWAQQDELDYSHWMPLPDPPNNTGG